MSGRPTKRVQVPWGARCESFSFLFDPGSCRTETRASLPLLPAHRRRHYPRCGEGGSRAREADGARLSPHPIPRAGGNPTNEKLSATFFLLVIECLFHSYRIPLHGTDQSIRVRDERDRAAAVGHRSQSSERQRGSLKSKSQGGSGIARAMDQSSDRQPRQLCHHPDIHERKAPLPQNTP